MKIIQLRMDPITTMKIIKITNVSARRFNISHLFSLFILSSFFYNYFYDSSENFFYFLSSVNKFRVTFFCILWAVWLLKTCGVGNEWDLYSDFSHFYIFFPYFLYALTNTHIFSPSDIALASSPIYHHQPMFFSISILTKLTLTPLNCTFCKAANRINTKMGKIMGAMHA